MMPGFGPDAARACPAPTSPRFPPHAYPAAAGRYRDQPQEYLAALFKKQNIRCPRYASGFASVAIPLAMTALSTYSS